MIDSILSYSLPHQKKALSSKEIEENIKLGLSIKNGKELIESKYPRVEIEVRICGGELYDVFYTTELKGEKKEEIYNALSDFIKTCGTPEKVTGHCNDLVDKILQGYGKTVKGGFLSKTFCWRTVRDKKGLK